MTTRGRPTSLRPITPPDPTLAARPVPRTRTFELRSFGPGAAADIRTTARPLRHVQAEADPATYLGPTDYEPFVDDVRDLLQEIEGWEAVSWRADEYVERDPTWGFYVFITSYSEETVDKIPLAIDSLITVVQRGLRQFSLSAYADEAFRRFKLDVVQEADVLAGASDDRVREEFRAQIRGLQLSDDEDHIVPPARNMACLVLDEATVSTLASLTFPEDPMQDYRVLGRETVKIIDAYWQRDSASPGSSYRGVGHCPITSLERVYLLLTSGANGGAMEDLHPMKISL